MSDNSASKTRPGERPAPVSRSAPRSATQASSSSSSIAGLAAAAASSSSRPTKATPMIRSAPPSSSSTRKSRSPASSDAPRADASQGSSTYTQWKNVDSEPSSMWQAPQSARFPTGGYSFRKGMLAPTDDPVKLQRRRDVYFRRVAMPNSSTGPAPTKWQNRSQIAGFVLGAAVVVWGTLFHDFGPDDHVFRGIRQWVGVEERNPFMLSEDEKVWATEKGLIANSTTRANGTDGAGEKRRLV